ELDVADNQRVAGPRIVRAAQALFHVAAVGHVGSNAGPAEVGQDALTGRFGAVAERHDHRDRFLGFGSADHHGETLDPRRPADGGRVWAAERFNQPVVAAAADDRALGAPPTGDALERRVAVIIEAADPSRRALPR